MARVEQYKYLYKGSLKNRKMMACLEIVWKGSMYVHLEKLKRQKNIARRNKKMLKLNAGVTDIKS